MNKIEQLKAALAAATPGEWAVTSGMASVQNHVYSTHQVGDGEEFWKPVICVTDDDEPVNYEANAQLIALMKNTLPDLIEAVEALHQISLCSKNSSSSKEECGRIARNALVPFRGYGYSLARRF